MLRPRRLGWSSGAFLCPQSRAGLTWDIRGHPAILAPMDQKTIDRLFIATTCALAALLSLISATCSAGSRYHSGYGDPGLELSEADSSDR